MSYIARTSKTVPTDITWDDSVGLTDYNKWWYDSTYSTSSTALCLPNCTTYAMGRSAEIAGETVEQGTGRNPSNPMLNRNGFGNAASWFESALWETGDTPKLGAIACWTDNGNGWGGHVAIVEATDGTNSGTKLSMSGYQNASSGTRSFSNPGSSASWYFKYLDFDTTNYYYTTYNDRGGTFQGYIYNPYVTDHKTPTNLSNELITDGNIKYIEWKNSYADGDPFRYKITVAMNEINWSTDNKFNLFTTQPNSDPGDGYELAAVINGNIWGSDTSTSYPMGFTKVANESVGTDGVLQFLDQSTDNYLYKDVLSIGSTKTSGGSTLIADLYQNIAPSLSSLNSYLSALNGDLTTTGDAYCAKGAYNSAIHSFIGYNDDNDTAFMGFNSVAMTGANLITAVKNIFGSSSKVVVLDGGGSTQMQLRGETVRASSDSGGVRLVENAICIYQKEIDIVPDPVSRDTTKNQILIVADSINIRTQPNTTDGVKIGTVTAGQYYNVISSYNDGTYTWYKIGDAAWVANDGTWITYYEAASSIITVSATAGTGGTVSGAGTYTIGDSVIVNATPNAGYEFVQWDDGTTANPYSFEAKEDVSLTATFAIIQTTFPDSRNLASFVGDIYMKEGSDLIKVQPFSLYTNEVLKTRPTSISILENGTLKTLLEKYSITFDLNGGTGATDTDFYHGEVVIFPSSLTHEDYDSRECVFGGWFESDSFADKYDRTSKDAAGDRTYYAKWIQSKTQYKGNYTKTTTSSQSISGTTLYSGSLPSSGTYSFGTTWSQVVTVTRLDGDVDTFNSPAWSNYIKPQINYGYMTGSTYYNVGTASSQGSYVSKDVSYTIPVGSSFAIQWVRPSGYGSNNRVLANNFTYKYQYSVSGSVDWQDSSAAPEGSWDSGYPISRTVQRYFNGTSWTDWAA